MPSTNTIYKCETCGKEEIWEWGGEYIEHISPMGRGYCGWMYPIRSNPPTTATH